MIQVIIGESFGWAHLPKTGGTATLWMFKLFPEWADGHAGHKHSLFADHEAEIEGKLLVSNFRRLPDWVLSWAHHRNAKAFKPDGTLPHMFSPWEMAEGQRADHWLNLLLAEGRFEVGRWLRMESLAADFIEFLSQIKEVDEDHRRLIEEIGQVNAIGYDHDLTHWFTPAHVRRMYERNPLWASVEEQVYGDLALLD